MTTNIDKILTSVKSKKSGWVIFGVGLIMLIVAIPLMVYGICRATVNGISWTIDTDRKVSKLESKERHHDLKVAKKQKREDLKQRKIDLKNAKRQNKENAKRAAELNKIPAVKTEEN